MTPSFLIRPVLVCCAAASLGACGLVDSDPHRFENMANAVAAIPVGEAGPAVSAPAREPSDSGLRPALRVQVMDPHALWDARDGGLNGMVERAAPKLAAAAAPAVTGAVRRQVSDRIDAAVSRVSLRPAIAADDRLVQLGAYASEASARAAWTRLKSGPAADALGDLSPVYQAVQVNGRTLTRLKVPAPATGAAAICAAAGIDDPWCRRDA